MSAFWFVWNEGGRAPAHKHQSQESAMQEAERLARKHQGQTFVVLESVCAMRVDSLQVTDLRPAGEIPW